MADSKITALAAISTVDPTADPLVIVDVSDTSMAASGTTKKSTINQLLGSGGTATLASATITGDLTVDTNTLKVDSANDRVGIKTASPRSPFALDVLGNLALGDSTTTSSVRLKLDCLGTAGNVAIMSFATAGTNKAFFGLSGGYIGDASSDAIIGTDAAGAAIRFYTSDNGVEVARFNSTGNLAFANTKGIDFSATSSGSGTMTSELLNDYEEGTFTPTIAGSSSTGTGTYSVQTARYTKVGRLVTCEINITWSAHTGTGNLWISGLPFTPTSSVDGSVFCGILNNVALSAGYVATGYVASSVSSIVMHQYPTGGGASIPVPIDTAGAITVSAIYTV